MSENESEKRETSADIADEIRRAVESMGDEIPYTVSAGTMRRVADRIEAAWRREKSEIESDALAVGGIVEAARHKPGNAAAMREALERLNALNFDVLKFPLDGDSSEIFDADKKQIPLPAWGVATLLNGAKEAQVLARAALSAPARNCDRFRSEAERRGAFIAWYNEAFDLKGSDAIDTGDLKHDVDGILHDYIDWLFTTEKGESYGR